MKRIYKWLLVLVWFSMGVPALAANVVLGAGDVVKLGVFGNPDLSLETRVSQEGKISLPLIGEVEVKDLTTAAAESKIAGLLESGGYVKKPQVTLLITSLQSQQVSVLGYVNRPGRYPMEGKRSVIDVLALAGGINQDGGDALSLIRHRDGRVTQEIVDLMDIVRAGDLNKNYELSAGDIVYVERAPRFYIYGEVQRPGVYRLERNMTIAQALSAGGGLSPRGTERGLQVKRRNQEGKVDVINVRLDDVLQFEDVVYVKESLF